MKSLLLTLLLTLATAFAAGANTYERLALRAARSFEWKEWSSAAAMYELMLKQHPDSADTYVHAIVANQMIPDSLAAIDLVERAMAHDLGLGDVLSAVRSLDFAIGQGDLYGRFLYSLRSHMPWMRRGLDNQLLDYYMFRDDGPMIVHYANLMLAGLPDSRTFLAALAHGYQLQGRLPEAAAVWEKIIALYPDDYDTLLYLGNYLISAGEHTRAALLLSRAYAIKPTPYVQNLLKTLEH